MKYLELAKEILENKYPVVGVRSLQEDEQYEVGDYCRESYEWDLEHDCSTYDLYGEEGEKQAEPARPTSMCGILKQMTGR